MIQRLKLLLRSRTLRKYSIPFLCWYIVNIFICALNSYQLLEATARKDHQRADYLLGHGAYVNMSDEKGRTVLIWAISAEDVYLVKAYLSHGANVNLHDSQGRTALTWAGYSRNTEITFLLKKAGAIY
jgi:ankyrin repeat protein